MNIRRADSRRAAARARWLGELGEKLRDAQRTIGRAGRPRGEWSEMAQLRAQIEGLLEQVDQLQRGIVEPGAEIPVRDL